MDRRSIIVGMLLAPFGCAVATAASQTPIRISGPVSTYNFPRVARYLSAQLERPLVLSLIVPSGSPDDNGVFGEVRDGTLHISQVGAEIELIVSGGFQQQESWQVVHGLFLARQADIRENIRSIEMTNIGPVPANVTVSLNLDTGQL